MRWSRLFPAAPARAATIPYWVLVLVALASTVRSLIHMHAADGGAQSIAGIPVTGPSGSNIVALFGQWGASQLVLALIYWVVIVRYRDLVPLMWLMIVIEQALRFAEGHFLKPIISTHVPPGEYGTYALFCLGLVMLVWSLWQAN